jgi:hypothetical protein
MNLGYLDKSIDYMKSNLNSKKQNYVNASKGALQNLSGYRQFSIYHGYSNEPQPIFNMPKNEAKKHKLKPIYICSFEEDIIDVRFIDMRHVLYGIGSRILVYERVSNTM